MAVLWPCDTSRVGDCSAAGYRAAAYYSSREWGYPYPVSVARYTADCEGCGQPCRRWWKTGQPKLCLQCGVARAQQAALEMAARSGPHYDAWLASRGPAGRPRTNGAPPRSAHDPGRGT